MARVRRIARWLAPSLGIAMSIPQLAWGQGNYPNGYSYTPSRQAAFGAPTGYNGPTAHGQPHLAEPSAYPSTGYSQAPTFAPPPRRSVPQVTPSEPPEVVVAARQAKKIHQVAVDLAERGASFSSKRELLEGLRCLAHGLDAAINDETHQRALAVGLRTLEEANDFIVRDVRDAEWMDVSEIVQGHQTTLLHSEASSQLSLSEARDRYLALAAEQIGLAVEGQVVGSEILLAMGKLHQALSDAQPEVSSADDLQAEVYLQASLFAHSDNFLAANEYGVLLAKQGRLGEAKSLLLHALSLKREPEVLQNLAVVHHRLGELELANRARRESDHLRVVKQQTAPNGTIMAQQGTVHVLQPGQFRGAPAVADNLPTDVQQAASQTGPAVQEPAGRTGWLPWSAQRR